MNGRHTSPRLSGRTAAIGAVTLIVVLPLLAFFVAPTARAADSPGANLAGINATSSAAAVQIAPLIPGVLPAGPPEGNVVEADIPYASASSATGPSSSSLASPAYPGDTATGAGNAITTFAPNFPAPLAQALNYSQLARADYPAQFAIGTSSNYTPPGLSGTGVGTASARAGASGATSQASTSRESFGAGSGAITVASSTVTSTTKLQASEVEASSHNEVGTIDLLGGLIRIAGLTSDASATSDGNSGTQTSDFKVGSVTVAGVAASIGSHGISLDKSGQSATLIPVANQALTALAQAGISVHTIAPVTTEDGPEAAVSSGALIIQFVDANIPNPNGQVPVSSIGFELNLGQSQASSNATALPPIPSFSSSGTVGSGGLGTGSSGSGTGVPASLPGSAPVSGSGAAVASAPAPQVGTPPGASHGTTGASPSEPARPAPPATLLGAPIRVAWVVIAFLLSLVAAGPLLSYANWQLLRGRRS